jgi:hypothetical protein
MRVRTRGTVAGPWGVIQAGQEGDVPDDIGRAMVSARAAEEVGARAAVPEEKPAPEVTSTEAPEKAAFDPPKRRRAKHA